jgi:hypothetical protein
MLGAAGAGALTGAMGALAITGFGAGLGFGATGFGAAIFLAAAFFLGAALLRATFFFAAFRLGAAFRFALRATLRADFFRAALDFVFKRTFLAFAAFFLLPARFFFAFFAAIASLPFHPVVIDPESLFAGDSKLSREFRQARFAITAPIACPAPTSRHRPAGWCR